MKTEDLLDEISAAKRDLRFSGVSTYSHGKLMFYSELFDALKSKLLSQNRDLTQQKETVEIKSFLEFLKGMDNFKRAYYMSSPDECLTLFGWYQNKDNG